MVSLFTDGKLEGRQTLPQSGPWPSALTVWFWGVEPAQEAPLEQWATGKMGLPETQLNVVRFSDWETVADKIFGQTIGRPYQNVGLIKRLQARTIVARQ